MTIDNVFDDKKEISFEQLPELVKTEKVIFSLKYNSNKEYPKLYIENN